MTENRVSDWWPAIENLTAIARCGSSARRMSTAELDLILGLNLHVAFHHPCVHVPGGGVLDCKSWDLDGILGSATNLLGDFGKLLLLVVPLFSVPFSLSCLEVCKLFGVLSQSVCLAQWDPVLGEVSSHYSNNNHIICFNAADPALNRPECWGPMY